jgi:hypothetical protein
MSIEVVYKLFVKSVSGEWVQVGPNYDGWFPFLYEDSLSEAVRHYERLGLETRTENSTMGFDDRR